MSIREVVSEVSEEDIKWGVLYSHYVRDNQVKTPRTTTDNAI